jgi:methylated-DNA-[protein]-cysteine S-methyltransferase
MIEICADAAGITALNFVSREPDVVAPQHPILRAAVAEVAEYFRGERNDFTVPLSTPGTAFQKEVWRRLVRVPYGQTTTYSRLARAVGRPRAGRAVGQANHRNPVSIIIPCHRVLGSDGRLVGYGSGLWRKEWLLAHEKKHAALLPGFRREGGK